MPAGLRGFHHQKATDRCSASYCGTEKLQNWGCGDECTTVPGGSTVELLHAGGDNDDVPYCELQAVCHMISHSQFNH